MQTLNAAGRMLDAALFIEIWDTAAQLAPPRFLTMRLHSDRYKELYELASIPKSIQIGDLLGSLGRRVTRVACVAPPNAVPTGITLKSDDALPLDQIVFDIHGNTALVVENIGYAKTLTLNMGTDRDQAGATTSLSLGVIAGGPVPQEDTTPKDAQSKEK